MKMSESLFTGHTDCSFVNAASRIDMYVGLCSSRIKIIDLYSTATKTPPLTRALVAV